MDAHKARMRLPTRHTLTRTRKTQKQRRHAHMDAHKARMQHAHAHTRRLFGSMGSFASPRNALAPLYMSDNGVEEHSRPHAWKCASGHHEEGIGARNPEARCER